MFPAHAFRWLYLVCRPPRKARAPLQGFQGRRVELADDGGVGLDAPGLKVCLPANTEDPVQKQPKEDLVSLKFSEDIYPLGMTLCAQLSSRETTLLSSCHRRWGNLPFQSKEAQASGVLASPAKTAGQCTNTTKAAPAFYQGSQLSS